MLLGLRLRAVYSGNGSGGQQCKCVYLIFDGAGVGRNDIEVEVVSIETEWLPGEL